MNELYQIVNHYQEDENFIQLLKNCAVEWAKKRLHSDNSLILDLETTGLIKGGVLPEIVQISLVSCKGKQVLTSLVKPPIVIPYESIKIHGISNSDVNNAPSLKDLGPALNAIMTNQNVICYNAGFDISILTTKMKEIGYIFEFVPECAMEYYSAWRGAWSTRHKRFKRESLPPLSGLQAHNSLNDCLSVYNLMRRMAGEDIEDATANVISLDF